MFTLELRRNSSGNPRRSRAAGVLAPSPRSPSGLLSRLENFFCSLIPESVYEFRNAQFWERKVGEAEDRFAGPEPEPAPEAVSVGQPEQAPRQMAANDAELEQIMREVEEIERTSTRPGPNTEDGESVWRDD